MVDYHITPESFFHYCVSQERATYICGLGCSRVDTTYYPRFHVEAMNNKGRRQPTKPQKLCLYARQRYNEQIYDTRSRQ